MYHAGAMSYFSSEKILACPKKDRFNETRLFSGGEGREQDLLSYLISVQKLIKLLLETEHDVYQVGVPKHCICLSQLFLCRTNGKTGHINSGE